MNILKKIFGRLFKLSLIIIGIALVVGGIIAIKDYYSSDEYKYKSVIGKTFPIINELSSLVDIGSSSLKVLENGDVSIKFRMTPTKERLFKSSKGNTIHFALRDIDGFEIDTFSIESFVKTKDDNDEVLALSCSKAFEGGSYRRLSTMQESLIHTDSIVLDTYIGLDLLEPFKVRQAALEKERRLEEERKRALEVAQKRRAVDEESSEQKRRDKLYADTQKLLSEIKKGPSLSSYKKMGFDDKMGYEDKHIVNIKIGMTYDEMVKSMGDIIPRSSWNKNKRYFQKAKQFREAYRYGNYIVYFYQSTVDDIEYERL